jgi:hypothetical protein
MYANILAELVRQKRHAFASPATTTKLRRDCHGMPYRARHFAAGNVQLPLQHEQTLDTPQLESLSDSITHLGNAGLAQNAGLSTPDEVMELAQALETGAGRSLCFAGSTVH